MVRTWVPVALSFVVVASAIASIQACSSDSSSSGATNDAGTTGDGATATETIDGAVTSATDGGADAAPGVAEAITSWTTAFCGRLATCFPAVIDKNWGGLATCTSAKSADLMARLEARGTGWTAASASACAATLGTVDCTDFLVGRLSDACVAPAGTRAPAAPCIDDGQCTTRYCNIGDRVDDTQPATCGFCDTQRRAAGDACTDTDTCPAPLDCSPGLACADYGVKNGAPCNTTTLFCNTDATCVDGMCAADVMTSGAACDPTRTTGPGCAWGSMLRCGTGKTCEAIPNGACTDDVTVCKPASAPDLTSCPTTHP